MGNFSRDSFRATNALNNLLGRTEEPVEDARHYVGVRLQQGVPVLDADINELEDVRRHAQEAVDRFFIGDGVPIGSDGFRVSVAGDENDFVIEAGVILAGGALAWNPVRTTYRGQPNFGGQPRAPRPDLPALDPLAPPEDDVRHDLVVLDVWEREVDYAEDERLVDSRVGVDTTVRWQREWVVRVHPDVSPESRTVPDEMESELKGHRLYPIARIRRTPGADRIEMDDITDLRRTDLTLARGEGALRVYGESGALEYDVEGFAAICGSGLDAYDDLLHSDLFLGHVLADPSPAESVVLLAAFENVRAEWRIGRDAARRRTLGSRAAMEVLRDLLVTQRRFHDRLRPIAEALGGALLQFLEGYRSRLGTDPEGDGNGLEQAVEAGRLREAIEAQIAINHYIAARTGTLPVGSVGIVHHASPPVEQVVAPGEYRFVYALTSRISMADTLDITVEVEGAGDWSAEVDEVSLALDPEETRHVKVDLTLPPATAFSEGTLVLRARSKANPGGIDDTHDMTTVRLNEPPPIPVPITIGAPSGPIEVSLSGVTARQITVTNEETAERDYTVTFTASDDAIGVAPEERTPTIGEGGSWSGTVTFTPTDEASDGDEASFTIDVRRQDDPAVSVQREVHLIVRADE